MKRALMKLGHWAWRLLPRDWRRDAMAGVAARLAVRPARVPPPHSHGVVIAGDVAGANGLAESARILHHVVAAHGFARGFIPLGLPSMVPRAHAPVPADAALIAVVNAPILPVGLLRYPKSFLRHRRVIGLWAWELPVVPPNWRHRRGVRARGLGAVALLRQRRWSVSRPAACGWCRTRWRRCRCRLKATVSASACRSRN